MSPTAMAAHSVAVKFRVTRKGWRYVFRSRREDRQPNCEDFQHHMSQDVGHKLEVQQSAASQSVHQLSNQASMQASQVTGDERVRKVVVLPQSKCADGVRTTLQRTPGHPISLHTPALLVTATCLLKGAVYLAGGSSMGDWPS